jgi:tetratricopeptide (TPR) repeat protein
MKHPFLQLFGRVALAAVFIAIQSLFLAPDISVSTGEDIASLMSLGDSLLKKGEFERAIGLYSTAVELAEKTEDHENLASCLLALGQLHWNVGKLDVSSLHYSRAYEAAVVYGLEEEVRVASIASAIHDYYQQGKELAAESKYSESIQAFNVAINLASDLA